MLIINADDWGRSSAETDAALQCYKHGRITSVSAMVFMQDSERAATLAKENQIDVGLHLNFFEPFSTSRSTLKGAHDRVITFLRRSKYAQLLYNPFLREALSDCYNAQAEEFIRLYGGSPSHIDGHHHMHLCANLVFSAIIPAGTKVRRNFCFWSGEKGLLNRAYRGLSDRWLARRYRLADYFFDLTQCLENNKLDRVRALAKSSTVELMTHPILPLEMNFLMSDEMGVMLQSIEAGSFARREFAGAQPFHNRTSLPMRMGRRHHQSSCDSRTST